MPDEFCPHCGDKVPLVRDAFCVTCGEALDEPPPVPRTPEQQQAFRKQLEQRAKKALGAISSGRISGVKTFTAAIWGTASKVVLCENCKWSYVYEVKRRGQGEAMSTIFDDQNGAQHRAAQEADRDLKKALQAAIDIVPCPACGWIQSDMQDLMRRHYRPRLKIAGIVLLVASIVPLLVLLGLLTQKPLQFSLVFEYSVIIVVQIATGLALLWARSVAAKNYDPNATDVEARLQQGRQRASLLDEGAENITREA